MEQTKKGERRKRDDTSFWDWKGITRQGKCRPDHVLRRFVDRNGFRFAARRAKFAIETAAWIVLRPSFFADASDERQTALGLSQPRRQEQASKCPIGWRIPWGNIGSGQAPIRLQRTRRRRFPEFSVIAWPGSVLPRIGRRGGANVPARVWFGRRRNSF
jgi:hypothetical protein